MRTFFVGKDELLSILNNELLKHDHCSGARILPRHISLLDTVNPRLFKWDISTENGKNVGECQKILHQILPELKEKYIVHLR